MIDNGKGTVINIASIGAFVTGGGGAAYTSAKHGIAGYTKQLSFDYGLKGIKANAIAPGAVDTGMTHAMFEEGSADVMKNKFCTCWSLWPTRGNCTIVTLSSK